MYDEGDNLDALEETEEAPPEESGNRNFWIIGGVLIFLILTSVACMAYYGLVQIPKQKQARLDAQSTQVAERVAVDEALTASAVASFPTATASFVPTETPVFQQQATTATVPPTAEPQTATVAAANTQAAQAQLTITALPTSTLLPSSLPDSGFFDNIGAPGLFIMAAALVAVILLARKLRASPAK